MAPLPVPPRRERLYQPRQSHAIRLPPVQDRLHVIRRQQGESQQARDVGRANFLCGGQLVERGGLENSDSLIVGFPV